MFTSSPLNNQKINFVATSELLKALNGDVSDKSLKVTELLVGQSFPTSVIYI